MNFMLQFIQNIFEIGINLIGFNTQRNKNLREPIQSLELIGKHTQTEFNNALGKAGTYLEGYKADPAPDELVDCFRPSQGQNNWDYHPILKYIEVNYDNFDSADDCVSFAISAKSVFLPDFVSEFLQRTLHMHTYDLAYTGLIRECQYFLFMAVFSFSVLCGLYIFLQMCLFINPYTYPFILLTELVLPYYKFFEDVFPQIGGFTIGSIFAQSTLVLIMNYIRDIVFTMPFLPSEGVLHTAAGNANDVIPVGQKFYLFTGIPKLWKDSGIPIDLRTDWFDEGNFGIFKFYESHYPYSKYGIDYLPMDVPRLKILAQDPGIDPAAIQRMYNNITDYITSTGLTGQELRQLIKDIIEGIHSFQ
uniref:Uncharacterized protein n=1 Tax=Proboscia sp. TaxID=1923967 RepID=A0A2U9NM59_9STRA|nr:hypothetical protein ycf89 [Proboscia sp.]AWT38225.1 hypothetical protein ycf89 [Proboscia sp.]